MRGHGSLQQLLGKRVGGPKTKKPDKQEEQPPSKKGKAAAPGGRPLQPAPQPRRSSETLPDAPALCCRPCSAARPANPAQFLRQRRAQGGGGSQRGSCCMPQLARWPSAFAAPAAAAAACHRPQLTRWPAACPAAAAAARPSKRSAAVLHGFSLCARGGPAAPGWRPAPTECGCRAAAAPRT